jgi:putative flippase GtrA
MKTAVSVIHDLLVRIPRVGWQLATVYLKLVNPVNYALVGGIGVVINFLVFYLLIGTLPWWVTNFLAILVAWSWNWSMSVGPWGWLWGFKKRPEKQ